MSLKVAIVGFVSSKLDSDDQDKVPFIADTFNQLGADIQGFESDSLDSRREHIETAIQTGRHVFCEKPLWWPSAKITSIKDVQNINRQTTALVNVCNANKILLQLNSPWPYTLPSYYELYSELKNHRAIESFSMWLTTQFKGSAMLINAVPDVLSMLYCLNGAGKINNIESNFHDANNDQELLIEFDYLHAAGDSQISISLASSNAYPKPAAYAINGLRADRHVELPNYRISLHSAENQIPVTNPLACSIKNFISTIHSKSTCDEVTLIDGMTHLAQIFQAVTQN